MNLQVAVLDSSWETEWRLIQCISRGLQINCCEVNGAQTFRIILQRFLYFIRMVYNTVSLKQHIISGPVRHIVGVTSASVSLLWSYKAPQFELLKNPCSSSSCKFERSYLKWINKRACSQHKFQFSRIVAYAVACKQLTKLREDSTKNFFQWAWNLPGLNWAWFS